MFCPKCGAANDASARFCTVCGAAMPAHQPSVQSTQSIPVVVQQVRPAPVQLVPAHPTAYTHALTGCGRSLSYLFAAIALTAVAVLHLLDLLLGISGGIESVWAAIDASPSGLMQFLQAAFWLPELLTVIGVWSAAGACRSRGAQISTGGLNCLRTAAVFRIIFEALELTFLLIYLLFYSAEDFFSFHFAGEEYVVFVMAGGCALTIVLQGCIIAALNSANEAAVKARATTLPPMLLAVIVMAEAAMQIIGLAMYWVAPYLDYDIALQLYGMFCCICSPCSSAPFPAFCSPSSRCATAARSAQPWKRNELRTVPCQIESSKKRGSPETKTVDRSSGGPQLFFGTCPIFRR